MRRRRTITTSAASLFRTAIENCGVGAIPIDKINGAVDLSSKCEIADERSSRKLTQRMGLEAITLSLRVQKLAWKHAMLK
jgi:hypothetical protein